MTLNRGEHIRDETNKLLAVYLQGTRLNALRSAKDLTVERRERLLELLKRMVALWSNQQASGREELVRRYNCGDAESLAHYLFERDNWHEYRKSGTLDKQQLERARAIESELKQRLIFARNGRMADRVYQLLYLYPRLSFFFAFGAGLRSSNMRYFTKRASRELRFPVYYVAALLPDS